MLGDGIVLFPEALVRPGAPDLPTPLADRPTAGTSISLDLATAPVDVGAALH